MNGTFALRTKPISKWIGLVLLSQSFVRAVPLQGAQEYAVSPTPLQAQFAKLQSAFEEWRVSDPYIERDVFRSDPGKVLVRIDNAEKRVVGFLDARRKYYEVLLSTLSKDADRITQLPDGHNESQLREARRSANEQSVLLGTRSDELERTISDLQKQQGKLDAAMRLQEERDDVNRIRDALRKEIETFDAMMDQGTKVRALRERLKRSQDGIAEGIRRDMTDAESEQALWKRYYQNLRGVAKSRMDTTKEKQSATPKPEGKTEPKAATKSTKGGAADSPPRKND